MNVDEREITLKVSQIEEIRRSDTQGLDAIINTLKEQAGYSGFTNFETYKTYLFLKNNLKVTNKKMLDTSPYGENIGFLADYLSDSFKRNFSNFRNRDFYSQTLLENDIAKVNWKEIAAWLVE